MVWNDVDKGVVVKLQLNDLVPRLTLEQRGQNPGLLITRARRKFLDGGLDDCAMERQKQHGHKNRSSLTGHDHDDATTTTE